jgi:hypothetical protein
MCPLTSTPATFFNGVNVSCVRNRGRTPEEFMCNSEIPLFINQLWQDLVVLKFSFFFGIQFIVREGSTPWYTVHAVRDKGEEA